MEGVAESLASLLKLFSGALADKLGVRKPIVTAGYTVSSLAKPIVAVASSPWHVLAVRIADRTGKGIRTAPRDALIADSVDESQRGVAFGLQRTMDHAGAVTGPLAAALLLSLLAGNMRLVFALSAVPALLCIVVLAVFVREVHPERRLEKSKTVLTLRPFDRVFLVYLAVVFLFTLGNSSDAFILLRASDMGLSMTLVPVAWVVLHVVKMVTSMPAGIVSDKVGRRKLIVAGWVVYAAVYAGFAVGHAPAHAWTLFAVYGVYFGFTEGVEKAFVADLVPADLRGTAYGAFNFAVGIGALPASVVMGILWSSFGPRWAFGFGAGLALLASLLLAALVPEGRREVEAA